MVSDWLHGQCTQWYASTSDINKSVKNKADWGAAPMSSTELGEWTSDASRLLKADSFIFDPTIEYFGTSEEGCSRIRQESLFDSASKRPPLISACEQTRMDIGVVQNCMKQSEVLLAYITAHPVFSMVPKDPLSFSAQGKAGALKQTQSPLRKIPGGCQRLVMRMQQMSRIRHLIEILHNIAPTGKDPAPDERRIRTVCRTSQTGFDKYGRSHFKVSTMGFFPKRMCENRPR